MANATNLKSVCETSKLTSVIDFAYAYSMVFQIGYNTAHTLFSWFRLTSFVLAHCTYLRFQPNRKYSAPRTVWWSISTLRQVLHLWFSNDQVSCNLSGQNLLSCLHLHFFSKTPADAQPTGWPRCLLYEWNWSRPLFFPHNQTKIALIPSARATHAFSI